jgi:hypothetical protein
MFDILGGFVVLLAIVMIILSSIVIGVKNKPESITNAGKGLLTISILMLAAGIAGVVFHRSGYTINKTFF